MISVVRPRTIPAMIDSTGNPGTAGITRGVVELDVCVIVTVAAELVLDVSLEVLLVVLVTMLLLAV